MTEMKKQEEQKRLQEELKKQEEEQKRLQDELKKQEQENLKRIEEQIKQQKLLKDIQGGFDIDFNEGKVQRNHYFRKSNKKKPKIVVIEGAYDYFMNPRKEAIKKKGGQVFSQREDYSHVQPKVDTWRIKKTNKVQE